MTPHRTMMQPFQQRWEGCEAAATGASQCSGMLQPPGAATALVGSNSIAVHAPSNASCFAAMLRWLHRDRLPGGLHVHRLGSPCSKLSTASLLELPPLPAHLLEVEHLQQ